jgi:hypothetical protein
MEDRVHALPAAHEAQPTVAVDAAQAIPLSPTPGRVAPHAGRD